MLSRPVWDVDDTAELLYRDWLRIAHAAGNRQGLHTAIARLQQVNRALDFSLETETKQLMDDLLNGSGTACRKRVDATAFAACTRPVIDRRQDPRSRCGP
jgi:uncharacterized protein YfiM (DUF2279 family)